MDNEKQKLEEEIELLRLEREKLLLNNEIRKINQIENSKEMVTTTLSSGIYIGKSLFKYLITTLSLFLISTCQFAASDSSNVGGSFGFRFSYYLAENFFSLMIISFVVTYLMYNDIHLFGKRKSKK